MREIEQILSLWDRTAQAGESAVLATVVKTSGSSYRNPGARLLLTQTGQRAGSISGGCLEDDLVKKAWWLTENGPAIRRYDTTPDGEIGTGFGLGCNGIIYVLLERLSQDERNVLDLVRAVRASRQPAVWAHVVTPLEAAGQYLSIDTSGTVHQQLTSAVNMHAVKEHAAVSLVSGDSQHIQIGGTELFVETLRPAVRLLIFGAGDDAVPLSDLAKYLGWHVSVIDGRAHYARREKFPNADAVIVRNAGDASAESFDRWTVAVLMTHSYSQDLDLLGQLGANPPAYLGILGPRKRSVQLLIDAGIDAAQLAPSLHTPMGLDIGADGPEQVAIAVIAEIQAFLNGRAGGQLRDRQGSIHAREQSQDSSSFNVHSIVCA
jgi:xanthine dehydrogenase accessory factor